MGTVQVTIRDLFILSLVLILVAYYAGAIQLGKTLFTGTNMLLLTATGRDQSGQFAPYPSGGTTDNG